jgi:hypothetical protein
MKVLEIKVTNGWFTGEKLFVNNELQGRAVKFHYSSHDREING